MMKLQELYDEYNRLEEKMSKIYNEISEITDGVVLFKGIKCEVISFDVEDNSLVLKSINKELLNKYGTFQTLSVDAYDKLPKEE